MGFGQRESDAAIADAQVEAIVSLFTSPASAGNRSGGAPLALPMKSSARSTTAD
jgi:hypothetical protein